MSFDRSKDNSELESYCGNLSGNESTNDDSDAFVAVILAALNSVPPFQTLGDTSKTLSEAHGSPAGEKLHFCSLLPQLTSDSARSEYFSPSAYDASTFHQGNSSSTGGITLEHSELLATKWKTPRQLAILTRNEGLSYRKGKFSDEERKLVDGAIRAYQIVCQVIQIFVN